MAKWIVKAGIQKGLSYLPRGEALNLFFQRRVTRGLPRPDSELAIKAASAAEHVRNYLGHARSPHLGQAELYEFGAGWDLLIALTCFALGADHQTVSDVRPNLRPELVNDAVRRLNAHRERLEERIGHPLRDLGIEPIRGANDLTARFGIRYVAPSDAADTGLPPAWFDLVSSTETLEHIPAQAIPGVLAECHRLLKPGGIMSSYIDMGDHFSYMDGAISAYNFLKFSPARWRLLNSPLSYQNRLRAPDYHAMFERAGFELLAEETDTPEPTDLTTIRSMKIAPQFRDAHPVEALAVKWMKVVHRRPADG